MDLIPNEILRDAFTYLDDIQRWKLVTVNTIWWFLIKSIPLTPCGLMIQYYWNEDEISSKTSIFYYRTIKYMEHEMMIERKKFTDEMRRIRTHKNSKIEMLQNRLLHIASVANRNLELEDNMFVELNPVEVQELY